MEIYLIDNTWETSWYECVTDPQFTQVTWSGGQPDQDIMLIFPGKKKLCLVVVDSTNGLTILKILTIKVASNFQLT